MAHLRDKPILQVMQAKLKRIHVAVVEDNERVRGSLVRLLEESPGFTCLSACSSAEQALEAGFENSADVVLMDINLPGQSGIECVAKLKARRPELQFMMLTVYEDADKVLAALKAGATGYLLKRSPPAQILASIQELFEGGSPMTSQIARKVVASFTALSTPSSARTATTSLSTREREILEALSKGLQNKEIAEQHDLSIATVRAHLRNIYEKLHVQNRTEATRKWLAPG
jgi:DNA-binding NarL/FixJ family response regulator